MLILSNTQAADWQLKREKNNIRVYTKEVETSEHYAFKATSKIKTNTDSLVNLMRDMDVMEDWLETCKDPIVINEPNPSGRVIHMKNVAPFIVISDRDLVLLQQFRRIDSNTVKVDLIDRNDRVPKEKGYVRGIFNGHWQFTDLGDGHIEVEYQGLVDPAGAVPAWMSNLVLIDTPYKTLKKIRKFLHDRETAYNKEVPFKI